MARIKLSFPKNTLYSTQIRLRISDINYGGHIGNDSVLSLAHEARLQFLYHLGYSELDIEGYGLIMNDAAIVYLSEGRHPDLINVEIAIEDLTKIGFDLYYKFKSANTSKDIAIIKTGLVFFNYATNKIQSVPKDFISKVKPGL